VSDTKVRIYEDLDHPLVVWGRNKQGKKVPQYWWEDTDTRLPVIAGGSTTFPEPVFHPLAAPTISGTTITVDLMLQQPTRVTQFLMDITLQRFVLDRIFTSPGGVSGGAVVYDLLQANDIYTDRDVEPVAPGAEFPIVTSQRRAPRVAEVEKYGGKYYITDEAKQRNDQSTFRNHNIRLGNTIVRKLNTRAVSIMDAAITANAGQSEFIGHDWSAAIPNGSNPTAPAATPGADFAMAQLMADQRELGIQYNVALVNPVNLNELRLFYQGNLEQMLRDNGYDEVFATNRIPVGTGYFAARQQLGQMRLEQPLATETWRTPEDQRNWVQSSVRPVAFVDNPFAVVRVTGL
jgi:hypothetical protein